jgi:hypothetical protein
MKNLFRSEFLHQYHDYRENNIIYFCLKPFIFVEVDDLWISRKKFACQQLFSILCPIFVYFILSFCLNISTKGPSSRQARHVLTRN